MSKILQCTCAEHGSVDFHSDDRPTLVLVGNVLYDLVPSARTMSELVELPFGQAPHVRHLNRIPLRTAKEQRAHIAQYDKIGTPTNPGQSAKIDVKVIKGIKKASSKKISKPIKGDDDMARTGKVKVVVETLQQKALTTAEIVALGVASTTVSSLMYNLRKRGYIIDKSDVAGKVAYKIVSTPKK